MGWKFRSGGRCPSTSVSRCPREKHAMKHPVTWSTVEPRSPSSYAFTCGAAPPPHSRPPPRRPSLLLLFLFPVALPLLLPLQDPDTPEATARLASTRYLRPLHPTAQTPEHSTTCQSDMTIPPCLNNTSQYPLLPSSVSTRGHFHTPSPSVLRWPAPVERSVSTAASLDHWPDAHKNPKHVAKWIRPTTSSKPLRPFNIYPARKRCEDLDPQ
jgi:hypothetical protein